MILPKITDLSWDISEEDYRASQEISYSLLSRFARGGPEYINIQEEEEKTESLLFGGLVDDLLTGGDISNYAFYDKLIPDKIKSIIDYLFNNEGKGFWTLKDISEEIVIDACNNFDFYTSWKNQTRINKIYEHEDYWQFLINNIGKTVLPKEMIIDAEKCVSELKSNEWTRDYFVSPQLDKTKELYFQLKFRYKNLKCMVDILKVDHTKKRIHLIDLKTTSSKETKFNESFYKWGYLWQSQLYSFIVNELCKTHKEFKDYRLEYFTFVCINKKKLAPLIWHDTKCFSVKEREYNGETYPSWSVLCSDLLWHKKNQLYKYPKECYINNGNMTLI